ncbi:hypothetical protein ACEWY4_013683 [Coilia grayii]|uniref:ILEI/PANDER domain-containing protein n=1 Tax=Coilia grayii TaxID=363190 RepID=A0ABD1JX07_9TELE
MWTSRKGKHKRGLIEEMRKTGILHLWMVLVTVSSIWTLVYFMPTIRTGLGDLFAGGGTGQTMMKPLHFKCGVKACPDDHFAFQIKSGIANILGPRICFEGRTLMSGVSNNIMRGINIALLKGDTGELIKTAAFDMYAGKPEPVVEFLQEIKPNTIILVASYDEPAAIITREIRDLFFKLGSNEILELASRESWVFAGASGAVGKSPYERVVKNNPSINKYGSWPDTAYIEGCFPKNPTGKDLNMKLPTTQNSPPVKL